MNSLRWRLFLVISAVSAATLAAVGIFSQRVSTQMLETLDRARTPVDDVTIVSALKQRTSVSGLAGLDDELRNLAAREHVDILVVSPQGSVLAASLPELKRARVERQGNSLHVSWSSSEPGLPQSEQQNDVLIRGVANNVVMASGGKPLASIYLLPQPRTPPPAALAARIGGSIWVAVAIGVACALCAALVLSSTILRPVRALTAAAKKMSAGDFAARVRLPGNDEIAELGRSFDSMAENLDRLERLRVSMVADIAHELRSPLTNIRAHIEALQDRRLEPDAATFASLAEEARLLERLVADLQDLSMAEAGRITLRPERVDLAPAVNAALEAFGPQTRAKHIEARSRIAEEHARVQADPERLRQILHNLLANAVTYTPDGGQIVVSANPSDAGAEVVVFNSGAAIPESELAQIFERFYRVDRSRTRATGGAGLGLAITKQLVEAHGGRVWAENVAGGVAMHFTLPLTTE
jgi:signal transduction histidine kinase